MSVEQSAVVALRSVLANKAGALIRDGQERMTRAVARAIEDRIHLLVEAGTGTGKSLAYLVPALSAGVRTVVATATKNLQNQLADQDLPFLQTHLDVPFTYSVLKGRQSYLCMAKLAERFGPDLSGEGLLFADDDTEAMLSLVDWARAHPTGDRDDLVHAMSDDVWRSVSVSGMECPGRTRCPEGSVCFAEAAYDRAAEADVVVTNHHLYGLHVASGGYILPEHDLVIFDEAHRLEESLSNAFGVELTPGRFHALAGNAQRVVDPRKKGGDPIGRLRDAAEEFRKQAEALPAARLQPNAGELGTSLRNARRAADVVGKALVLSDGDEIGPEAGPLGRTQIQLGHLIGDIDLAFELPDGYVAWAEPHRPAVRVAPVEVAASLAGGLLTRIPTVLTSATLSMAGRFDSIASRLGFVLEPREDDPFVTADTPIPRTFRALGVEGSFDYGSQGLLYIAAHLPDPRDELYLDDAEREVEALVDAARGRALVLTTSYAAMRRFAEHLSEAKPYRVLVQNELSRKELLATFAADETSVLIATMGFWEGIDVPGPALSLVILDKVPFTRPDDPLHQARREAVESRGMSAFESVDLPRAAMLLAQGAGRLIRHEHDRGVVAVLDRRLVSKRYGLHIIRTLPPFPRTTDRRRVLDELAGIGAAHPAGLGEEGDRA